MQVLKDPLQVLEEQLSPEEDELSVGGGSTDGGEDRQKWEG